MPFLLSHHFVSLHYTWMLSLLIKAPSRGCLRYSFLFQHHCCVAHTLMALLLLTASQLVAFVLPNTNSVMLLFIYLFFLPLLQLRKCFQSDSVELKQQVTWAVYKLLKGPNRFFIGGTFLAKWDNRLHFGTFLERLQPAPHHSATFLISVSKCSLDTLFKRVARQTCTTYSCLYIEIYLELQYIFCYICQETVCIVYCWIECILNCQ